MNDYIQKAVRASLQRKSPHDIELVAWFKEQFAARTPPKTIADAHPDYRVNWHEVQAKMRLLGYGDNPILNRIAFAKIWHDQKLRTWCNRLIRKTRGLQLVSRESECAKATRESYS